MLKFLLSRKTTTPPKQRAAAISGLVFNCITKQFKGLGSLRVLFGSDPDAQFVISAADEPRVRIALTMEHNQGRLVIEHGKLMVLLNNSRVNGTGVALLPKDILEQTLQIGNDQFFLIKLGEPADLGKWKDEVEKSGWILSHWLNKHDFDQYLKSPSGFPPTRSDEAAPFLNVLEKLTTKEMANEAVLIHLEGSEVAFQGRRLKMFGKASSSGTLRCPRCWELFDAGTMLAIHPTEKGDDKLDEGEQRRFVPSRIGADGRALDEGGRPCSGWACPHCRGKLPQGFHISLPKMISLVGESFAGKSYFLTVSINQLKKKLMRDYQINFTDTDAAENKVLNNMIATLFNAHSSEEAALDKTEQAGDTYHKAIRFGKSASLPQPFTYQIRPQSQPALTIIVYDNAGEQFRPDVKEEEKALATEHLAWSSSLIYLFDPVQHRELLKKHLGDSKDPQVEKVRKDKGIHFDQDVILSEIAGRMRQWKGLPPDEKANVPLALVVGKYDVWEHLLPKDRLRTDFGFDGALNLEALEHNSTEVRNFLMNYCQDIVNAVEMISSEVRYFPVSAFGASAVRITSKTSEIGPPKDIEPFLIEAPWLWLFSRISPKLFEEKCRV